LAFFNFNPTLFAKTAPINLLPCFNSQLCCRLQCMNPLRFQNANLC
jgi:hypothetical protein